MNIESVLHQAGLAGNEIKVYLALLDLGSAKAGDITKQSGVNRTNVYDALDRLTEKGLVSYVVTANRKYFQAASVERLAYYLEEEQRGLRKTERAVRRIIPELNKRQRIGTTQMEATIFKGKRGVKAVAEQVLKEKNILVLGAEGNFVEIFSHYAQNWHRRRGKLGIPLKIIFKEELREKKTKRKYPLSSFRFTQAYSSPSTTWIFGNSVAIIIWQPVPVATVIKNKKVAKSYTEFFKILWKEARNENPTD